MFVHSSRFKKQIEYLNSKGIDTKPLYRLAEISPEELNNPDKLFSFEQFHVVLEYAIQQTGDDYYGLRMGQEPHIAGTVGMMAASCKNLREAFIQGCKFFKVQGNFADISFIDDKSYPRIVYTITNAWKLRYPETARHEVDAMFSFLMAILTINSNNTLKPVEIRLCREEPDDPHEYVNLFKVLPTFNQDDNEMVFRANDFLIPMKAFNPETFEILKKHIESQLKRFNNQESVAEKVKTILLSSMQYQFPDIEIVASKLNTSPRTLQRKLSDENTSFKSILLDTKFDLACQLLKQDVMTISDISYTLGYSDIGNFSRSFKKYKGVSPLDFKASVK